MKSCHLVWCFSSTLFVYYVETNLAVDPQRIKRWVALGVASVAIAISLASHAAEGFAACPQFFAKNKPPAVSKQPTLRELCYDAFAILHSGQTKTPIFVAQRLSRQSISDANEKRTNKFFSDSRLPRKERSLLEDYKRSGYSRGHMAPAADMPTPLAMEQSFSLANVVPQARQHNSGAWAKIEKDTRHYVKRAQGDVFVITGPVFDAQSASIGGNQVRVPKYLFKLVYDVERNRAWVHWHENQDGTKASPPISYAELVKRTGVDFLPAVIPLH